MRIFSSLLEITLKEQNTKWNDKQTGKTTNTLDDIKMYKLNWRHHVHKILEYGILRMKGTLPMCFQRIKEIQGDASELAKCDLTSEPHISL